EEMLLLARPELDRAEARRELDATLANGDALERFRVMVDRQGGEPRAEDDPPLLPTAPVRREVRAARDVRLPLLPPRRLGELIVQLGGGRRVAADTIDAAVGLEFSATAGERVAAGEACVTVHARDAAQADLAVAVLEEVLHDALDAATDPLPLLGERITVEDH